MNYLAERDRITDIVNRLFILTDNRDWPNVERLFTESVYFDMKSISGTEPSIITPQQIAAGWDAGLKPLKATHHQAGNLLVTIRGNEAEVFCYGTAWHYLPNSSNRNTRTFVGSYEINLMKLDEEWKIDRFKYNLKFIDGNRNLEQSAAADRAA